MNEYSDNQGTTSDPEAVVNQLAQLLRDLPEGRERDDLLNRVEGVLVNRVGRRESGGAASPGTDLAALSGRSSAGFVPWQPSVQDWADQGSTSLDVQFQDELKRLLSGNPTPEDLPARLELSPRRNDKSAPVIEKPPEAGLANSNDYIATGLTEGLRPMPGNHVRDWPSMYALALIEKFGELDGVSERAFTHNYAVLMEALHSTVHGGAAKPGYKQVLSPWAMLPKPPNLVTEMIMNSKSFEARVAKKMESSGPDARRGDVVLQMADQAKDDARKRFISLVIGRSNSVAGAPLFTWRLVEARRVGRDATLTLSPAGTYLLENLEGLGPAMPHSMAQTSAFLGCLKASPEAAGDLSGLLLSLWSISAGVRTDPRQWRAETAALFEAFFPSQWPSKGRRAGSASELGPKAHGLTGRGIAHARGNILFHAYTARCREWGLVAVDERFAQSGPPELTEFGATVLKDLSNLRLPTDEEFPIETSFADRAESAARKTRPGT